MPIFIPLTVIALLFSQSFGAGGVRCGTVQFMENSKKSEKRLAKPGFDNCRADNYYITVSDTMTKNFIIYYTTDKTSPHAVTREYIDSLAKYLEEAYNFHKNLGMAGILGQRQTWHYRKSVPLGFYPVEVIDTGLLRGEEGEYSNAYGLVFPVNTQSTQMIIENDFLYGANCSGASSTEPFYSHINGDYSRPGKWHLALKVTVFHELYHSFQINQVRNMTSRNTFWLEASATGVEELAAPEVNDYVSYVHDYINYYIWPSLIDSIVNIWREEDPPGYNWAPFYLFLASELGQNFDSFIWKSFFQAQNDIFPVHLARYANSLEIDAEYLFHKYASYVFYSGKRAKFLPDSLLPIPRYLSDLPIWPERAVGKTLRRVLPEASFYFLEKTSENPPSIDSVWGVSSLNYGDSSVWVLSRLLKTGVLPPKLNKFVAYPNPWNPRNPRTPEIKFAPLPENSTGIEIRSSNGVLLDRIKGNPGDELTWGQNSKKPPAPGILYYRTLPHGKNKVLIVEY